MDTATPVVAEPPPVEPLPSPDSLVLRQAASVSRIPPCTDDTTRSMPALRGPALWLESPLGATRLSSVLELELPPAQPRAPAPASAPAVLDSAVFSALQPAEVAPPAAPDRQCGAEPDSPARVWMESSDDGDRAWLKVNDRLLGPLRVELTARDDRVQATVHVDRPEVGRLVQACETEIRDLLIQQQFREVSLQVRCGGGETPDFGRQDRSRQPTPNLSALLDRLLPAPRRSMLPAWGGLVEVWA